MKTRHYILLALTFSTCLSVVGQTCDCAKSWMFSETLKADTAFHLTNGETIVLCGYKNPDSDPTTFSEFILSVCGQDTIIDFWGAVLTCRLRVNKDTLVVDQLENLPTGKNFIFQETVWTTEKIYFSNRKVVRNLTTNKNIRKYNEQEIQTVLTEFENTKKGYDERKMDIAYRLFIAAISGNEKARKYFFEFDNKFWILDGADRETYSDLSAMLKLWLTNE